MYQYVPIGLPDIGLCHLSIFPSSSTLLIASSTDVYNKDDSSVLIPSFTLPPVGDDKSSINRHLPALPFFGMTPKGLQCTPRASALSALPTATTLPASLSLSRYPRTTSGWRLTDERFCLACLNSPGSPWYPTRNPCRMPLVIHSTSCCLGDLPALSAMPLLGAGCESAGPLLAVCSALPLTSRQLLHLPAQSATCKPRHNSSASAQLTCLLPFPNPPTLLLSLPSHVYYAYPIHHPYACHIYITKQIVITALPHVQVYSVLPCLVPCCHLVICHADAHLRLFGLPCTARQGAGLCTCYRCAETGSARQTCNHPGTGCTFRILGLLPLHSPAPQALLQPFPLASS